MEDQDSMIAHFKDVTGVDDDRARFYLESSAWQIEVALAGFFENDSDHGGIPHDQDRRAAQEELFDLENELANRSQEAPTDMKTSKSKQKKHTNFGTLRDLNDKDSSSEDEEGQAFYAGGSEASGQQILGPGKKKDFVKDMFKTCKEHSVAGESSRSSTSNAHRPNTFGGTGYKLGMTSNDTEVVSPSPSERRGSEKGFLVLKLWRNGFTINDRELRFYEDPENQEFLDAVKRGEVPEEIRREVEENELRIDMEDHRYEEFVCTKAKVKAFTGKGQMLGSPSPATAGMTVTSDPADQAANEALARNQLNLNTEQPLTSLQIRLADGSNVRAQFNLTHTIGDVRRYIITMRPQYALRDFTLQTTFPTKELTEESKTIEEANLQNSAIMQRLK